METNQLEISGLITKISRPRYSPTGVPHQKLMLQHQSKQQEAGVDRVVECMLEIQFSGDAFQVQTQHLQEGQRIKVSGFLTKKSHREPNQIKLQVQTLECID